MLSPRLLLNNSRRFRGGGGGGAAFSLVNTAGGKQAPSMGLRTSQFLTTRALVNGGHTWTWIDVTPWTHQGQGLRSFMSSPGRMEQPKKDHQEGQQQEGEKGEHKEEYEQHPEEDLPLVAKLGMGVKVIFKLTLFGAIVALVCYTGYYILKAIVPTSHSPLSLRNDAAKVLETNPDVSSQFGHITRVRGMDMGGRGEGRRNYVPSYVYEADGRTFTRIKFEVDNDRKQSATVYAEAAHDRARSSDFNYLMLRTSTGKVITITDNRKPEKPKDLRKYDVAIKLQNDSARFYHGGPDHATSRQQEQILAPHFDYIKQIRCDRDEERCKADGFEPGTLVYKNKTIKAPKSLDELEKEVGLSKFTRPGGVSYQDSIE